MHEISIARSILENSVNTARRMGFSRVTAVRFRVGVLRQVDTYLLQEAFDAARQGTICKDAVLCVEQSPLIAACEICGKSFDVIECNWVCPQCGGADMGLHGGEELELVSINAEMGSELTNKLDKSHTHVPACSGNNIGVGI